MRSRLLPPFSDSLEPDSAYWARWFFLPPYVARYLAPNQDQWIGGVRQRDPLAEEANLHRAGNCRGTKEKKTTQS